MGQVPVAERGAGALTKFKAGKPENFSPGSVTLNADQKVYIVRAKEGYFYALSAVCTSWMHERIGNRTRASSLARVMEANLVRMEQRLQVQRPVRCPGSRLCWMTKGNS